MGEFTFETVQNGADQLQFNFKGCLDEKANLPEFTGHIEVAELVFNFSECKMINSMGIKKWVTLMDRLQKLCSKKIVLTNCPIMVVHQVNLIKGFLPQNGEVESIYFPLTCTKCDEDFSVLGKVSEIKQDSNKIIADLKELECYMPISVNGAT